MGRVNPFFARAGMIEYRRWAHRSDQRLIDALAHAGLAPWALAATQRMRRMLAGPGAEARLLRQELARWAGRHRTLDEQLARARDHLLCEPVYYLHAAGSQP
jgi:hypothetical protein